MKAEDFRLQFPTGFEHDVLLEIKSPNPVWEGKKGKFVEDRGDFVLVVVESGETLFAVQLPWAQVQFEVKGKA